jgi:hypothetical protein
MIFFSATNYFFPQPEKNIAPSGIFSDFVADSLSFPAYRDGTIFFHAHPNFFAPSFKDKRSGNK